MLVMAGKLSPATMRAGTAGCGGTPRRVAARGRAGQSALARRRCAPTRRAVRADERAITGKPPSTRYPHLYSNAAHDEACIGTDTKGISEPCESKRCLRDV